MHTSADTQESVKKTRDAAVNVHHHQAELFESMYCEMRQNYLSSAFAYGRSKLDNLLMEILSKLPPGGKILDVGCGTGEQIKRYLELGFNVSGIEPAPGMIAIAQRTNPETTILEGSILRIPFPDRSFDFVQALEVLRYLDRKDWPQAYGEMLRVLRPGGTLCATLVNRYALDGFYLFHHLKRLAAGAQGNQAPSHCEFVTPGEAMAELVKAGAEDIQVHGRMFAPLRFTYKFPMGLGSKIAGWVDKWDDSFAKEGWHKPLAGHLIVVARRPAE
jgi:ubiquinone/menaquinone biosynthesis C-methylase UbiE